MRKLTESEVLDEVAHGTGIASFGCELESDNGKMILVLEGQNLLFEKDEVDSDEYKKAKNCQWVESQPY